jgi:periplasmic divalent cation tolerance protein
MSDFILVFVTTSNREEAENIALQLINSGSAPCVNIIAPIFSVYQWKENLVKDEEALMIIKSSRDLFATIRDIVEKNHSYDVPEVISIPFDDVSDKYGSFLAGFLGR